MGRDEVRAMGSRMLAEARALRAAFPNMDAMHDLRVSAIRTSPVDAGDEAGLAAALGYLRDEMLVVQAGRAADLTVLDDEMANVERLLGHV